MVVTNPTLMPGFQQKGAVSGPSHKNLNRRFTLQTGEPSLTAEGSSSGVGHKNLNPARFNTTGSKPRSLPTLVWNFNFGWH